MNDYIGSLAVIVMIWPQIFCSRIAFRSSDVSTSMYRSLFATINFTSSSISDLALKTVQTAALSCYNGINALPSTHCLNFGEFVFVKVCLRNRQR